MADEEPTYLIDTSSLHLVRLHPNANAVWSMIIGLIEAGRLFTVPQVLDELANINPAAYALIKPYRGQMALQINPVRLFAAGEINENYRSMSRAKTPNDNADPWLVGVAKLEGHVVVTNEKNKKQRIPRVCDKEGVKWTDLDKLIEAEGPED